MTCEIASRGTVQDLIKKIFSDAKTRLASQPTGTLRTMATLGPQDTAKTTMSTTGKGMAGEMGTGRACANGVSEGLTIIGITKQDQATSVPIMTGGMATGAVKMELCGLRNLDKKRVAEEATIPETEGALASTLITGLGIEVRLWMMTLCGWKLRSLLKIRNKDILLTISKNSGGK